MTGPTKVTRNMITPAIDNIDNTSDANKPVSTAQAAADAAVQAYSIQRANHTGSQLASTISNFASTVLATVITGLSTATSTAITATDTILVALGKLQAQITSLTTTVSGKLTASSNLSDVASATTARSNLGLGNVDNTSDVNKPVSTAQQTALNLKANLASPTFTGTVSGITGSMVGLGNVTNDAQLKSAAGDFNAFTAKTTPVGADIVLIEDSAASFAKKKVTITNLLASALTNPMSTGGDIIFGGTSGVPTRLANGTSGQVLTSAGGTSAPTWSAQGTPSLTILTATSSVKTPGASGQFQALTGNSVTLLSGGTYEIFASAYFGNGPFYGITSLGVYGSNGADNGTPPTALTSTTNLTVNSANVVTSGLHTITNLQSGSLSERIEVTGPIIVTVSANVTVYGVTYCTYATAGGGRVTVCINARRIY